MIKFFFGIIAGLYIAEFYDYTYSSLVQNLKYFLDNLGNSKNQNHINNFFGLNDCW